MQVFPQLITPSEAFDVSYFIRNPLDSATYYVRARIYDVRTGEVLSTVSLTRASTNSRLFMTTVQAPADPVGLGRTIVAIASVYTDSAYSTQSDAYEEQEQYFLIRAVSPFMFSGGGGFDSGPMEERLEKKFEAMLKALPRPSRVPDYTEALNRLYGALGPLQREINRKPNEHPDLTELTAALADLKAQIAALPEPEKVDLAPVTALMQHVSQELTGVLTEIQGFRRDNLSAGATMLKANETSMNGFVQQMLGEFQKGLKDLFAKQQLTIPLDKLLTSAPQQEEQAKTETPDLTHIM
jgi:hypothetical protein